MNAISSPMSAAEPADHSLQLDKLFEALAQAQSVDLTAGFNRTNPHFKNKYADLSAVWETVRKALPKHGLSVVQFPIANGADVSVRTLLGHSSGQWIASTITAKAGGADPQKIGSAITYLRRYGLCAMVGVVADDDDDGEQAAPARQGRRQAPPSGSMREEAARITGRATQAPEPEEMLPLVGPDGVERQIGKSRTGAPAAVVWAKSCEKAIGMLEDGAALVRWRDANAEHFAAVEAQHPEIVAAVRLAVETRLDEIAAGEGEQENAA